MGENKPLIDHWVNDHWLNFGCGLNALKARKPLVDLRLYLTKMSPNISKFSEGRQAHPSHWTGDHGIHRLLWIKFFKNTILCLLYQAWGATTMCREWKGGDGTKKFEKHCTRSFWCSTAQRATLSTRMHTGLLRYEMRQTQSMLEIE